MNDQVKVEDLFTENDISHSFEISINKWTTYLVRFRLTDDFGDMDMYGVFIKDKDDKNNAHFVFDINREEHLRLASEIYKKVCELKNKHQTTKASGKRPSRVK